MVANHFGRPLGNKFVGSSMETVTANSVLFVRFVGNAVQERLLRHCLMESGIEYTHLRHLRQYFAAGIDS